MDDTEHGARGDYGAHHANHAGGAHEAPGGAGGSLADDAASSQDPLSFAGWDAALALLALAALAVYALVVWRSRRGADRPMALAFVAGLAVASFAAASPLGSLVERGSHLAYMVQLEVLMNVAPPLFVLGLRPVLRFAKGPLAYGLSRAAPMFGLGIWLLAVYAPHLPMLHTLVLGSPVAYALQLAGFAVAGTLFWVPIVGSEGMRLRGKLAYLALAQAGAGVLAALLIWYPGPIYAHDHGTLPFDLSALADQRLSGVVMMVADMVVASTVAGWLFLRELAAMGRRPSPATE